MLLTDKIRKQMTQYIFEEDLKVKRFYRELQPTPLTYETVRNFGNGTTNASGLTIDIIDQHLREHFEGYSL